jgi:formiminoglutamase
LDAHTDVRPLKDGEAHSGSPFRQALEHQSNCAEKYLVAGLQPHSVALSHLKYIEEKNGHCLFRDETNITSISGLFFEHDSDRLMVTFDMDAVDQSQAPGVSAPCANGLASDLWLTAAYMAGRNKKVASFDLSEVNPFFDQDNQTAKLAALTIWHFLLGLSQR